MTISLELIIAAFLLMTFLTALISVRLKIPYTVILVIIGTTATITLTALSLSSTSLQAGAESLITFLRSLYNQLVIGEGGGLFVGLVIPPLIFEAMIQIRVKELRGVVKPALALATIGVIVATVIGGLSLWLILGLTPIVAFLFAALIAPTDVVTVLEVFKRIKVPSKLATLLQTEAALNDAPAIVIFTLILSIASLHTVTFVDAAFSFSFALVIGALIGLGVAFGGEVLSSLIEDRAAETILAVAVVYGSYALATGVGASGLIAVAVAGLYFGNFTMRSAMEPKTKESVLLFWQIAAFLGNTIAFLLIGFQANLISLPESVVFILAAYGAVAIGRAAAVYPIFAFFKKNLGGKASRVWSNIAFLGGVRGAVSIALAATIGVSALISAAEITVINTMVFGVAFISITIQVPLLFRYARKKLGSHELATEKELNRDFEAIQASIKEVNQLKEAGLISQKEVNERIDDLKRELDDLVNKSAASLQTKDIIQERAYALINSLKLSNHNHRNPKENES